MAITSSQRENRKLVKKLTHSIKARACMDTRSTRSVSRTRNRLVPREYAPTRSSMRMIKAANVAETPKISEHFQFGQVTLESSGGSASHEQRLDSQVRINAGVNIR